jgi:hypothetical protein
MSQEVLPLGEAIREVGRLAVRHVPTAIARGWPFTDSLRPLVQFEVELGRRLLILQSVTGMPAEWWRPHAVALWHEMSDPSPWEISAAQTVDLMIAWASLGQCDWPSKWPDYALR